MKTIEQQIKQAVFQSPIHKAHVNILFTASVIEGYTSRLLRPLQISPQQFNILRILKGQDPKPVSLKEISERMIDKNSNASRLLEKLVQKNLVDRISCPKDRRQLEIRLTKKGKELLAQANQKIDAMHHAYHTLSNEEAHQLSFLLDKMRSIFDK